MALRILGSVLLCGLLLAGCGGDDEGGGGSGTGAAGAGGFAGNAGSTPMPMGVTCGMTTCAVGQTCVENVCKTPCTMSSQCAGGMCCDSVCVNTQTEHDHCGACETACAATETCESGSCSAAMCSGTPGQPVNPLDDEDAGESGPVFESNGCPPNEECTDGASGPTCQCGAGASCPVDQTCSSGGMCQCGDGPGCAAGQACCDDECADVQTDDGHCGSCGHACGGGSTCSAGNCVCPNATDTACGDLCTNLQEDEAHCGGCEDAACATGATCEAGVCNCPDGEIPCDGECVANDSEENCGTCGNSCDEPSTCRDPGSPGTAGGSLPLGCYCANVNEVPCDGVCVALGTAENCGACNDSCDAPSTTCRDRLCECPVVGETACGDHCVDLDVGETSTDPIEDCGQCGITCLAGATCDTGLCSCPGGSSIDMYCDEDATTGAVDDMYMCIDVDTTKNCGGCGLACLDDSECEESGTGSAPDDFACNCIGTDASKTHCDGIGCRNLLEDESDCGECGTTCPGSATCLAGICDCPGAASVLACLVEDVLACVNTDTNEDHCGECDNDCDAGDECCGGSCVDPDTAYDDDNANCGMCGNVCPNTGCGFLGLGACTCNGSGMCT